MSLTFENLVFGKYDSIHAPPVTNVCVIGWPRLKQTPVLSCLLGESVVESGMTQSFRMTVGIPRRFFLCPDRSTDFRRSCHESASETWISIYSNQRNLQMYITYHLLYLFKLTCLACTCAFAYAYIKYNCYCLSKKQREIHSYAFFNPQVALFFSISNASIENGKISNMLKCF